MNQQHDEQHEQQHEQQHDEQHEQQPAAQPDRPARPDGESWSVFDRWPWKLGRLVQNILLILLLGWLLWRAIPGLVYFATVGSFDLIAQQMLLLSSYLVLFIGFQLFLIYFILGRARISWTRPGKGGVRFDDYVGNPEALAAARHIVTLLQGIKRIKTGGGDVVRGLLLSGAPGTGKRYLARTIASEAAVPIGYLNAASLSTSRVGLGQIKVMMLYRRARKLAREYGACILLLDDIDALVRSGHPSSVLNELLLQIDPPFQRRGLWRNLLRILTIYGGTVSNPAVLTIATTSAPLESFDAALLRPGRFDRQFVIALPDAEGRRAILDYYLNRVAHEPLPVARIVADTAGYPPATIRQMLQDALIYAHCARRQAISYADIARACAARGNRLQPPPPEPAVPSPALQRRSAYYRAGLLYARARLTLPGSVASPAAAALPHQPAHYLASRAELLAELQTALAGRAAEELLTNTLTSCAADDLRRATELATLLVGAYAMDGQLLTVVAPSGSDSDTSPWQQALQHDDLRQRSEALLQEQYRQVRDLLALNRAAVTLLAEALLLHGDLSEHASARLLAQIEARHPFVFPDSAPQHPPVLVARRTAAPVPNSADTLPTHSSQRFAEPEPALPDEVPPHAARGEQPATPDDDE